MTSFAIQYEYGPFGELLSKSGTLADSNPFQWSSKETDADSGLVYYGYRYYSAGLGRWINRDPIGEMGGYNLYGFVGNSPIGRWDYLGLKAPLFDLNLENGIEFEYNPYHRTNHVMTLEFKCEDKDKVDGYIQTMYNDLKSFNYFEPNRGGGVEKPNERLARFTAPWWPIPLQLLQWSGASTAGWSGINLNPVNLVTGLTYYNYVDLTFEDKNHTVVGNTRSGHIVEGERRWNVTKDASYALKVEVKTWANERTATSLLGFNHLTRTGLDFIFGDTQNKIWMDYFTNIGNHWKESTGAKVEGPIYWGQSNT